MTFRKRCLSTGPFRCTGCHGVQAQVRTEPTGSPFTYEALGATPSLPAEPAEADRGSHGCARYGTAPAATIHVESVHLRRRRRRAADQAARGRGLCRQWPPDSDCTTRPSLTPRRVFVGPPRRPAATARGASATRGEGGAQLALPLDRHQPGELHAAGHVFRDAPQREAPGSRPARRDRRDEAHTDRSRCFIPACTPATRRQFFRSAHREAAIASGTVSTVQRRPALSRKGDSRAARSVSTCNPLCVASSLRELIDDRLRNLDPVAHAISRPTTSRS